MMKQEELMQRLLSLKKDVSETSDGAKLQQIHNEVYDLMDLLLIEGHRNTGHAAEKLADYLEQMYDEISPGFAQIRTDILFSIEVCLMVLGSVKKGRG